MDKLLSKEKTETLDSIVRNLRLTLKNSTLYPPSHPYFGASIKNFEESLVAGFLAENRISLKIYGGNISLNGLSFKEKKENYCDIADYFHQRGVAEISFLNGIQTNELIEFFGGVKNKAAVLPQRLHIKIKEVDYSSILSNKKEKTVTDKEIWQSIINIVDESQKTVLEEPKAEALINFLKNSDKSASILNDLADDKTAIENICRVFAKIYKYFENDSSQDVKEVRNDMANIIVKFSPELIVGMFEETEIAKEITKDFSDEMISDFIVSLLSKENSVNENLLKVFNKLASGKETDKISDVVSLAADKLFSKNLPDKDIAKLQKSIADLFKIHSNNEFMSQMYKKTVEAFLSGGTKAAIDAKKVSALTNAYKEFLKYENIVREKTRCLLNILWLEENPDDFEKITRKLAEVLPELFNLKDVKGIREIFELFTDHLRQEQKQNKFIELQAKTFLNEISKAENIEKIISFIPEINSDALEDISYVLSKAQTASLNLLLDAFLKDKSPYSRRKFNSVLSKMGAGVVENINSRLNNAKDSSVIKDLLEFSRFIDPNIILKVFKREKDESVKIMAMGILINTRDNNILKKVFEYLDKSFFRRKYLLKFIKLCGDLKILESAPLIKTVLEKKSFLNIPNRDELRVATAVSLGQIGGDEALNFIKQRLDDKRVRVRRMCQIILSRQES